MAGEIKRLENAIGRNTQKIKTLLEEHEGSDLALSYRIAAIIADMVEDSDTIIQELQEDYLDQMERNRDTFEDRVDTRRDDRDDYRDRFRGRDSRRSSYGRGGRR